MSKTTARMRHRRRAIAVVVCGALVAAAAALNAYRPAWLHLPYASAPLTLAGAKHYTAERKGSIPPGPCRRTDDIRRQGYRCLRDGSIRVHLVKHRDDGIPYGTELQSTALANLPDGVGDDHRKPTHRSHQGTSIVEVAVARSWGRATVYSFFVVEGHTYRVTCSSGRDRWTEPLRRACTTFIDVDMM